MQKNVDVNELDQKQNGIVDPEPSKFGKALDEDFAIYLILKKNYNEPTGRAAFSFPKWRVANER